MSVIRYRTPGVAVVECPPACHTIYIWRDGFQTYYLSFPWTVFVLFYSDYYIGRNDVTTSCHTHVGFRNSPLTDSDQMLYYPQLHNIYVKNLKVCMDEVTGSLENNQVFIQTIENFWNSCFDPSGGLHSAYADAKAYSTDPRVAQYGAWQLNTHKNPGFITSVRWKPCNELFNILGNL